MARVAGSAWGQKGCYFPFNFSIDILTSSAVFSSACSLKPSRILKREVLVAGGREWVCRRGRGTLYSFSFWETPLTAPLPSLPLFLFSFLLSISWGRTGPGNMARLAGMTIDSTGRKLTPQFWILFPESWALTHRQVFEAVLCHVATTPCPQSEDTGAQNPDQPCFSRKTAARLAYILGASNLIHILYSRSCFTLKVKHSVIFFSNTIHCFCFFSTNGS